MTHFPYVGSKTGVRWLPAVPVTLKGPKGNIQAKGYVDSGADFTFIPMAWAAHLGVRLKGTSRQIKLGGAGGKGPDSVQALEPVDVIVAEIAGQEIALSPLFSGLADFTLGRADVFRAFVVTFDERAGAHGEVILDPYPSEET